MSYVLAFDLGASSGRALVGRIANGTIELEEIHRFSNDPVQIGNRLHWDILRLLYELKQALIKVKQRGLTLNSIAIDSWAVDFGLLDEKGYLLTNPFHYRDITNNAVFEEVVSEIGAENLFLRTGIQLLSFNTIFQLAAMKKTNEIALKEAKYLLMIPSLLRYFLTGTLANEFTNATTTQLFNPSSDSWDDELIDKLGLNRSLFVEAVKPGTEVGMLSADICAELGIEPVKVIAVAEHDTASAIAAVPALEENFAYISCGTWSLVGTEISSPIFSEEARAYNFTNEGGVNNSFRLLKNVMGLWMINESKRAWEKQGLNFTFPELVELAKEAQPFIAFIDVDDDLFLATGDMPARIAEYCQRTNQNVPTSVGGITRVILEGLALKYRYVLELTQKLTGHPYTGLHMIGGGIQNTLLCQWTANAIGMPVWAGPVEGSGIGNMLMQWIANHDVANIEEARKLVHHSFEIVTYTPNDMEVWSDAFKRYKNAVDLVQ